MKKNDFYKKIIFTAVSVVLVIFIVSKFAVNLIKSEAINIVNSKRFETFIINQINKKLEDLSNKKLNDEEYIFYKDSLKKIYLNYKPLFEEIKREIE